MYTAPRASQQQTELWVDNLNDKCNVTPTIGKHIYTSSETLGNKMIAIVMISTDINELDRYLK
jgi:hypothetical protein